MQTRTYPRSCTAAFCGKGTEECGGCPHEEALIAFKVWKAEHNAVLAEATSNPLLYRAQK